MPQTESARRVAQALLGGDAFEGYAPELPADFQGWNSDHPALRAAVVEVRPRIILDVGVWKGASTIFLARAAQEAGLDAVVVGIDTFLGSPEHWNPNRPDRMMDSLRLRHGWPGLYWQFLSNIVHAGLQDRVVPLAQTSENAAVILGQRGIKADLIHIDAAHEKEPVLRDCRMFWRILRPGGMLIGDDWPWPGVQEAAQAFAAETGLELEVQSPKWMLRKPG
jgi:predicted O-methyltransferase YrrM